MTEKLELTILRNLLCSEEYFRKVVPFLKKEYFQEPVEQYIFEEISDFASTYDKFPTKEVLIINLQQRNDLTEETYQKVKRLLSAVWTSLLLVDLWELL